VVKKHLGNRKGPCICRLSPLLQYIDLSEDDL
jgi:hypothetical protein